MAWLDPRPVEEDLPRLYVEYGTHTSVDRRPERRKMRSMIDDGLGPVALGYASAAPLMRLLSCFNPVREMGAARLMWLPASRRGRLLDIGCGRGDFLVRMRKLGWTCAGIEADPDAARIARREFGLDVHEGAFQADSFPHAAFDAVTLHHVLEHVPNPIAFLHAAMQMLKAGGLLVAVTPNLRSLGRWLFGRDWVSWDPPRHLFVHSLKSLTECARRAGFSPATVRTTARNGWRVWGASTRLGSAGRVGRAPNGETLSVGGVVFHAVAAMLDSVTRSLGEELVLFASK